MALKEILLSKTAKRIVFYWMILLVVVLGLYWRLGHAEKMEFLGTNNIVSYYYDLASRFNADLVWPEEDGWHFAPDKMTENAPPLSAYVAVYLYRLIAFFSPRLAFTEAIFYFPVLVFLVWAGAGFYLIKRFFGHARFSVIFLLLLALAPSSINLTKFGHYTEEPLGALWHFLAFMFFLLWQKEIKKFFLAGSLFFAVCLVLTWQQFHIIFAIYGLSIVVLLFQKEIKEAGKLLVAVLAALVVAQVFSLFVLRSAYLPSQMVHESYLGLINYNADFLKVAMSRRDWRNLTFLNALNYFGLWGCLVWLAGIGESLAGLKKIENIFILTANLAASALLLFFVKSVFVFLPFFLIAGAWGGGNLLKRAFNFKDDLKRIF